MGKLMKYELRKTLFSKLILLVLTVLAELVFLYGLTADKERTSGIGILLLTMCAIMGIMYIGIESILMLHRDMNTKQSYMLFLTPNSSYKILGAKVLENGISILLTGIFFAALAAADISMVLAKYGRLEEFLDMIEDLTISFLQSFNIQFEINARIVLVFFFSTLISWLATVCAAYLAVVLAATVLNGKKMSGVLAFICFIGLEVVRSLILNRIPGSVDVITMYTIQAVISLILAVVMYVVTAWIMDKKLSV